MCHILALNRKSWLNDIEDIVQFVSDMEKVIQNCKRYKADIREHR